MRNVARQPAWRYYAAIPLITAACAFAQDIRKPEKQTISLDGVIRLVHGFGPLGYGETPRHDAHVTYWAVETARPVVAIAAQKDFDCLPAKRLNLFFAGLEDEPLMKRPPAKWKDQHVTITGKIHCADTAGEMTSLYMDVDRIEAAKKH